MPWIESPNCCRYDIIHPLINAKKPDTIFNIWRACRVSLWIIISCMFIHTYCKQCPYIAGLSCLTFTVDRRKTRRQRHSYFLCEAESQAFYGIFLEYNREWYLLIVNIFMLTSCSIPGPPKPVNNIPGPLYIVNSRPPSYIRKLRIMPRAELCKEGC